LAFAAFLKHIGAPAERYLSSQGLAVYSDDPDGFVPLRRAWSFFDAAAHREDAALGWHVGRFIGDRPSPCRDFVCTYRHAAVIL
jgi:hypothetical protein